MRPFCFVVAALVALTAASVASAGSATSSGAFLPQGIDQLRQNATSKTEFTLDHSMLVIASKLDPNNEDLRRVIAGVSGVSVHDFRYAHPEAFAPQAIDEVREEYDQAGWTHVVNRYDKKGGSSATNVWVRFKNNAISNVAVLVAREKEVDLIEVTGTLNPLDLAHLCGHFGIPKIEGGIEVPNSERR